MIKLEREDVLKHEFQPGVYAWRNNGKQYRVFVYKAGNVLRLCPEEEVATGWKTNGKISSMRDLRNALLIPSVTNIFAKI